VGEAQCRRSAPSAWHAERCNDQFDS
jgi:hypothetical protein